MAERSERVCCMGWRAGAEQATALEERELALDRLRAPAPPPPKTAEPEVVRRGPVPERDPDKPTIGKWGILCLESDQASVAQAFAPLIEHRRERNQAWEQPVLALAAPRGGASLDTWRRRLKRAAGNRRLPRYLLIVGGPDRVPFELQFELDQELRTGRIDVAERPAEPLSWTGCRRFAQKVVNYERGALPFDRSVVIYSLDRDEATRQAHAEIVKPLAAAIARPQTPLFGAEATCEALAARLASEAGPGLVFSFSHGVEFPTDPAAWGALTDYRFRGDASASVVSARLVDGCERFGHGSILFAFACFSAGVPASSAHAFYADDKRGEIPGAPMVAPLPRALLGKEQGPVAFVGHVDRVTPRGFCDTMGEMGWAPYRDFADWTLSSAGTLGQALSSLRERSLRAAAEVAEACDEIARGGRGRSLKDLFEQWLAYFDYRGFLLLGDPALTVPEAS